MRRGTPKPPRRPALLTLFAGCLAAGLLCSTVAGAPATKSPEIDEAVAALKREYAASVRKSDTAPLREQCDYFNEDARAKLPLEALLAALEKPLPGGDNRQVAYVKWQLLSGLPAELDEPTVARLIKLYLRAPAPTPRYGLSKQDQKQLDGMIPGVRQQDDVKLTDGLEKAAERAAAADKPVIAFRDELYRRVPASKQKFLAAFEDAATRLAAAAQKDKLAEALESDLPGWALQSSTPRGDVKEITELLGKLRFVESPPYYAYASVRSGKLGWRTRTDKLLTPKKFADLHKAMLDAANPGNADAPDAKQAEKTNGKSTTKDQKKAG
jgi:hypothetical protein